MSTRGLQLLQPPAGEPVSVADLKLHLRVDPDVTEDDLLIQALGVAARQYVELAVNRQLVSAAWLLTLDRFPRYSSSAVWQYNSDAIWQQRLPVTQLSGQWYPDRSSIRVTRPPLQQLQAITYCDGTTGNQLTLVSSVAAGVAAPGSQAVTPATMTGITVGLQLIVDVGQTQETITVTAVTATTFTATFAYAHGCYVPLWAPPTTATGGTPLQGGPLVGVDLTTEPGRIAPAYGQIWPIVRQQLAAVQVAFVAGYGPVTSSAAAIAAGTQTVTPGSMFGIYPGTNLVVDTGPTQETIAVASVTPTTFTATFGQAHAAAVTILPAIPEPLRLAIKMLAGHWYENREAVQPGQLGPIPLGVDALLASCWHGEYE